MRRPLSCRSLYSGPLEGRSDKSQIRETLPFAHAVGNTKSKKYIQNLTPTRVMSDVEKDGEAPAPSPAPPAARDVHGIAWVAVVGSILSATFLYGLDQTIVANVQPAIVDRFDSLGQLSWVSVAFLLGAASSNLFW